MGQNLARKIIAEHLVAGETVAGREIAIAIDQTLTQDATGTMAWLQFEAMGLPSVRTELSVSYVDHNMLQTDFRNADDHRYLQSAAAKYGAYFSRPGNGTASATRYTWNASVCRARRCWAPTVTLPPTAAWGRWPSAQEGWT